MMDIAKSETFKNFTILNKALLFLIKLYLITPLCLITCKSTIQITRCFRSKLTMVRKYGNEYERKF